MRTDKLERAPGTGRHNNYSISGLLVMAKPESCADLQQRFASMDGVEIAGPVAEFTVPYFTNQLSS